MREFNPNHIEPKVLAHIGQKIVLFNQKNEILFLRLSEKCTEPGRWDFPGGGLDLGEDPLQGIIREIDEETLLVAHDIHPVHVESVINKNGEFVVMVGYRGNVGNVMPNLSWEHDLYEWMSQEKALGIKLPKIHRMFLEKAIEQKT
jgi:8-oxo-dGTP diphosphatase